MATIRYFDKIESDDEFEDKKKASEYSVFIDSSVLPLDKTGKISLSFVHKFELINIFFRELIIGVNDDNADILNNTKYIVCRIKEISKDNNSIIYNTSLINPDTDIIIDKSHMIDTNIVFESKYVFTVNTQKKKYDYLTLQFLNDKGIVLSQDTLQAFFADIKFNVIVLC